MDKYIGKRLDGRYEIKEIIGVGGMAYVYKAYDNIDNRIVAVKILKDEYLQNEEFTRRFKNESKAIAILSHPNIVKVYDVSFGDRMQYIVMEYIDGITLKEYIEGQAEFKWKEAVHFTVQILRALQHAHDKGIVHRDIKPQNIMLLPDGTIKVADFGIARFSRQDMRATRGTDKAIGSVHYISPEQARGEITDEKADIYSVGVMLYEMLTGKLPFEADSAVSVAIMQMQSEAQPPREINAAIPEGLEDITVKAMQKDTSKRYQSAAEMLYDIDEFKKNPSIHFEYKYFVDDSPTRYMDTISKVRGTEPVKPHTRVKADVEPANKTTVERRTSVSGGGIVIYAVVAAVVVATVIFLILFFKKELNDKTQDITVPNLVGMTIEEFQNSDYKDWFILEPVNERYDDAPKSTILEQSLREGSKVKEGVKTLKLTISKGPNMVVVPDVIGANSTTAKGQLENAGFKPICVYVYHDEVPKDCVISISPDEYQLKAGSEITVTISQGPFPEDPIPMPDVLNLSQEAAVALLEQSGFTADIILVDDQVDIDGNNMPAGTVVWQSVDPTVETMPRTVVQLKVSSGYKSVKVQIMLPEHIQRSVNLKIFVEGQERQIISGLLPSELKVQSYPICEHKDAYTVTVHIAYSDVGTFVPYARYKVDGTNGTVTVEMEPQVNVLDSSTPADGPTTPTDDPSTPTTPEEN